MAYELRFTFFSIYGPILYHFRDKARYWSKIATFSCRTCTWRLGYRSLRHCHNFW